MNGLIVEEIANLIEYKAKVRVYESVTSTNDVVFDEGGIVFALTQTNGRGRRGREFYSGMGGLYFSVSLSVGGDEAELFGLRRPFSAGRLTIAAGIAVAKALISYGLDARIKWVNDIYVGGKKVCGILAERRENKVAVGIGINVNSVIPPDLQDKAASLRLELNMSELAAKVINGFYLEFASPDIDFVNASCLTIGKKILCNGKVGVATRVDDDGALIVNIGTVSARIHYGEAEIID